MQTKTEPQKAAPAWANPTPAGLVALAVACFCFFAYLTGLVGKTPGELNTMPLMACWLLGGFFVLIVVAIVDLKAGNLSGGNTFLYFSAFFMLVGAVEMLLKSFVPALDTRIDGYAWTALTLVVWLWAPAFYKAPGILFLIIAFLSGAVPLIALLDLKVLSPEISMVFAHIAAYLLLICGLLGIYLSAVIIVNGTYGKEVLPNLKPFYKG